MYFEIGVVHECYDGSFRQDEGLIKAHLERIETNPNTASPHERKEAESDVHEEILGTIFFLNSNHNRYGQLIRETEIEYEKNMDNYPESGVTAFSLLTNYKLDPDNAVVSDEQY